MKRRDVIGLVFAVAVFAIAGVILYTQLAPAPKDTGIAVQVPAKVKVPLSDENDVTKLNDLLRFVDFSDPQKCTDEKCGSKGPIF